MSAATSTTTVAVTAPLPPFTISFWGLTIDPMLIILGVLIVGAVYLTWRAQKDKHSPFDLLDLLMDETKDEHDKIVRRLSVVKCTFAGTFALTSWVIIHQEAAGKLSADIWWGYLLAWVGPLTAKIIFNKTDGPVLTKPGSSA